MQPQQTVAKVIVDVGAYSVAGLTIAEVLPAVAAVFSIVWLSIQILEKITGRTIASMVKGLIKKLRG